MVILTTPITDETSLPHHLLLLPSGVQVYRARTMLMHLCVERTYLQTGSDGDMGHLLPSHYTTIATHKQVHQPYENNTFFVFQ